MRKTVNLIVLSAVTAWLAAACGSKASNIFTSPPGTNDAGTDGKTASAGGGGTQTNDASGGEDAGGTGGTGGGGPTCGNSTCLPLEECVTVAATATMICVAESVSITGGYAIDATEATYAQYQAWLATTPSCPPTVPGSVCSWKSSYNAGAGSGNFPVTTVDWCDAFSYCAGIGKRLCGKIGGGTVDFTTGWNDVTKSQWYDACTSGAPKANTYPYGATYDPQACDGYDNSAAATVVVGGMTGCTPQGSGFTGVFDLSGNVWEWEDSCNGTAGKADDCRLRGGSFYSYDIELQCSTATANARNGSYNNVGFRCCSSP